MNPETTIVGGILWIKERLGIDVTEPGWYKEGRILVLEYGLIFKVHVFKEDPRPLLRSVLLMSEHK